MELKKQKITRNPPIINALSYTALAVGILWAGNFLFCTQRSNHYLTLKEETSAYHEYVKILPDLKELKNVQEKHSVLLSGESKNALEERITVLTERKDILEEKLRPYDKKEDKWIERAIMPWTYFK